MALSRTFAAGVLAATTSAQIPCKQPASEGCVEPYLSSDSNSDPWLEYQVKFRKNYSSSEAPLRHRIWLNNTMSMIESNAQNRSYSLSWTGHSDLTEEEFRAQRLGHKKPVESNNTLLGFPYRGEYHVDDLSASLPGDWDWSEAKVQVVTPVKDQGQCGSCWSFSTTGALEGALAVGNGWTKSLSEQQFVDCDTQESGCSGGNAYVAAQWAKDRNICSEASYRYNGAQGQCRSRGCQAVITLGSIWGAYRVQQDSEGAVCSALAQRPLSIAISTGGGFMSYRGGYFDGDCGAQVDHAVLLVGYGYWNKRPYWKLKNSWNTWWGVDGYAILGRGGGGAQQCQILSDVSGVYVYGPYNPQLTVRGLDGKFASPSESVVV